MREKLSFAGTQRSQSQGVFVRSRGDGIRHVAPIRIDARFRRASGTIGRAMKNREVDFGGVVESDRGTSARMESGSVTGQMMVSVSTNRPPPRIPESPSSSGRSGGPASSRASLPAAGRDPTRGSASRSSYRLSRRPIAEWSGDTDRDSDLCERNEKPSAARGQNRAGGIYAELGAHATAHSRARR